MTGDFNYPEIDWDLEVSKKGTEHRASVFLETVQQQFLTQHVYEENVPNFDCDMTLKLDAINVSEDQMSKALLQLKISKSPGPDEINPRVLKELANELALPLDQVTF